MLPGIFSKSAWNHNRKLPKIIRTKKLQKNITSELLASFRRQLTETEDISAQLNDTVLNWVNCSKEGDACQEENAEFPIYPQNFFAGIRVSMECG